MPEPSDEGVPDRAEPTERRHSQHPPEGFPPERTLRPEDVREREVAAERFSTGDEPDAGGGLGLGEAELGDVGELPCDRFDRHTRLANDEVRGGGAEAAVAIEDEHSAWFGHVSVVGRNF